MLSLLGEGNYLLFAILALALIVSLSCHEYGHALVAKLFGDDTAEREGRLTLNPLAHLDPVGFLMIVVVGFGYAKPVPTNPRNFTSKSADLWVAGAGPFMNLVLAVVSWNFFLLMAKAGVAPFAGEQAALFFMVLVQVNLLLAVFNLIPLGPLDGHYILPHFLPGGLARAYRSWNRRVGSHALLALVVLSIAGIPVFEYVWSVSEFLLPWISFA